MPWKTDQVDEFAKGLSDKQKEVWVKIANGALKRCQGAGGSDECEAKAIKTASAMVKNMGESGELDWDALATLEEAATARSQALRLTRDLTALLTDRTVPKLVADAATALRSALKKTWTELAADADKDGVPDAEEPEPDDVMPDEDAEEAEPEALVAEPLMEDAGGAAIINEGELEESAQGPLTMRVQLIEPGFGNARDRHYYGAEMLKRNAHHFAGAKMYETDHVGADKSTRTWVSTVTRVVDFSASGAPIAEVVVHAPDFAQRVRNLKTAGLLGSLPCSIYAQGNVKAGKVNGESANLVEEITSVSSVDWVTRAGAGGKALEIAEAATDEQKTIEETEDDMNEEQVKKLIVEALAEYEKAHVAPVEEPKAAPVVTGLGERKAPEPKSKLAEAELPLWKRQDAIINRHLRG